MPVIYRGRRTQEGAEVTREQTTQLKLDTRLAVDAGFKVTGFKIEQVGEYSATLEPLNPRLDLWNHSPDGFEWGYPGSGPAQLALALCADVLKDDARAVRLHQEFKRRFVVPLDSNTWQAADEDLRKLMLSLGQG